MFFSSTLSFFYVFLLRSFQFQFLSLSTSLFLRFPFFFFFLSFPLSTFSSFYVFRQPPFSYQWSNDSTLSSYSIQSVVKNNPERINIRMQSFRVNVTNTGTMDGDEVVLAYIVPPQVLRDGQTPPIKQLFGFERLHLNVNETKQAFFPFNMETLLSVARDGSKWLHPGEYQIVIDNQRMFTVVLHGHSTLWKQFK